MILSLLLYLYEAVLKKYKFHAYFYTSALIFYFTKKADKMQVLFIKKCAVDKNTRREGLRLSERRLIRTPQKYRNAYENNYRSRYE